MQTFTKWTDEEEGWEHAGDGTGGTEAGPRSESSGGGGISDREKNRLPRGPKPGRAAPGREVARFPLGGSRALQNRGRDSGGQESKLLPKPVRRSPRRLRAGLSGTGLGKRPDRPRGYGWRPYLRSSTSASLSSSSRSNCLVTKLSTAPEDIAAAQRRAPSCGRPAAVHEDVPRRAGASTHQARAASASASGRDYGKMAAAVAASALPVTFGRLVSACSRGLLRPSWPGAGETWAPRGEGGSGASGAPPPPWPRVSVSHAMPSVLSAFFDVSVAPALESGKRGFRRLFFSLVA